MSRDTVSRDNVDMAYANAALFAEVAAHNHAVMMRRLQGADWSAPENQYRDAWRELGAED